MKFVILDHKPAQSPPDSGSSARTDEHHFDLMFEIAADEPLSTFATANLPSESGSSSVLIPLENHRREYLTYEGPVSNNRGSVTRHAHGTWTGELSDEAILSFDDDSKHFAGHTWTIQIDSTKKLLLRIA